MRSLISLLALLLLCAPQAWGATYYLNSLTGSDANAGTSPELAWKTLAKVNRTALNPGDMVLLKRGCTFGAGAPGQVAVYSDTCLVIPSSGTAGSPITFGAYGAGDRPVITGGIPLKGWSNANQAANVYKAVKTSTDSTYAMWFGVTLGTRVMTAAALNGDKKWQAWPDSIKVYLTSAADTSNVERSKSFCLDANGKNYPIISGISFRRGTGGSSATGSGNVKMTGDGAKVIGCSFAEPGSGYSLLLLGGGFSLQNSLIRAYPTLGGVYNYGDGNALLNNTIVNTSTAIASESGTVGTILRNNIMSVAAARFLYLIGTAAYTGSHNLFYASSYATHWRKSSTDYSSLALWADATGQDSTFTSMAVDPRLDSRFRLKSGSPARDAGDDTALARTVPDYNGRLPKGVRDIGAMEYFGRRQETGEISNEIRNDVSAELTSW